MSNGWKNIVAKLCVGPHMTPDMFYISMLKITENFVQQILIFVKILKMH